MEGNYISKDLNPLIDSLLKASQSLEILSIQFRFAWTDLLRTFGSPLICLLPDLVDFRLQTFISDSEVCPLLVKKGANEPGKRSKLKVLHLSCISMLMYKQLSSLLENLGSFRLMLRSLSLETSILEFWGKVASTLKHLHLPSTKAESRDLALTQVHSPLLQVLEVSDCVFPFSWISTSENLKVRANVLPSGIPQASSLWLESLKGIIHYLKPLLDYRA